MVGLRVWMAMLAVLLVSGCATAPEPPAGPRPLTILVSIDGFRPDYLNAEDTPTLARLAAEGVIAPAGMRPSYPSSTFPNHYTLVTGLRPDHHGIVSNTMLDPVLGGFAMKNKDAVVDRRWWDQGEPIWVAAERAGIRTATLFWPGSEADIRGVRPTRSTTFDQGMASTARVDLLLSWLGDPAERPGFATLYFDIVDTAGHSFGPGSPEVKSSAREVDAAISRLVDGLKAGGLEGKVNLLIVADHGMTAVTPGNLVIADLADPGAVRLVTGGAPATFALIPGQEARGEALLLRPHEHMTCWRKGEVPKRLAYGTNPRVPAIVCMAQLGWTITNVEGAARRKPYVRVTGAHGYDPAEPDMRALFLVWGPSVRSGATVGVFDNVGVYPLLARLIGVKPAKGDGTLPKGVLR
ncbi:MAG: alkaline phosphatase family protein [Caulobacteraceae bacterium]|nr:MAG: alkaline phosphatase family protein [Caulobacteraceae bacterium]